MTEPTCFYCGITDKQRCRSLEKAQKCNHFDSTTYEKFNRMNRTKKEKELNKMSETEKQLYDLANRVARTTIAVVDAMAQRGGIKGEELTAVGQLRDQSTQLIQLVESIQGEKS